MFWVYILRCNDSSYYTGHTDNLEARLHNHHNRVFPNCYTATRLPVELLYTAQFTSRMEALSCEQQKTKEKVVQCNIEKPFETAR